MLFRKKKKATRVVFLTKVYEWGGTEKHLEELIVRLDFSRIEPVVLCYGRDVYTQNIKNKHGVELEIRNGSKKSSFFAYWLSLVKARPDVIVFVNGLLGAFPWHAYVAARCTFTKNILAIEQLIAEPAPLRQTGKGLLCKLRGSFGWTARYMWKHRLEAVVCDRIIGVSRAVCQRLISEYEFPDHKVIKIWNGVDLKHFGLSTNGKCFLNGDAKGESSRHNLLCVARLSPERVSMFFWMRCARS